MPAATPTIFSGPSGEQLQARVQSVTAQAKRILDFDPDSTAPDDLDHVRMLAAAITDRLAASGDTQALRAHQTTLDRLRRRFESRFEALSRAQAAIAELREITSPGTMLARAPALLCQGSEFKRVILSAVRDSMMVAEAVHFTYDPKYARRVLEELRSDPVPLKHPLIETELLRRRRATLVVNADVNPGIQRRVAALLEWKSYVAAPLFLGQTAIGIIHADRGPDDPLDVLDRDVLWEFASALSQAYETATLRRTLQHERDQMRHFLEWLNARSGALTDAPISFDFSSRAESTLAPLDEVGPPAERTDDRLVFSGLLTKRELDVLRLLADGSTNKGIADALVLSDATVKFHVNNILRKLHVANRAEAVARYLALVGVPPP